MKQIIVGTFVALSCLVVAEADVALPHVFSDHMVLQRDAKLPIWGTAAADEEVTVSLAGQSATARADANGRWRAELKPLGAGGPHELTVKGRNTLVVHDVLVGEVWLCAGQSNMGTPLAGTQYWMAECPGADLPSIRFLNLGGNGGYAAAEPQSDVPDVWQRCTPASAFAFPAAAYFFGREVQHRLNVPVGLIKCSCWGSAAEPFVAREVLATSTNYAALLGKLEAETAKYRAKKDQFDADYKAKQVAYDTRLAALREQTEGQDVGVREHWQDAVTNESTWGSLRLGASWDGVAELKGQAGAVWYRRDQTMVALWVGRDLELRLGGSDGDATIFFNGERLEGDASYCRIPGRLAREGRNSVVVRVVQLGAGPGRLGGLEFMSYLAPAGDTEGQRLPMHGDWKYRAGYLSPRDPQFRAPVPRLPPAASPAAPGAIHNAMIAPLAGYAMKGALWYQGESNAQRAHEYQALLTLLVESWRKAWGPDFAFLLVQLPSFVTEGRPKDLAVVPAPPMAAPGELPLGWAPIREAMLKFTQTVPKVGMAVTIDIGEPYNIHPDNKRIVGRRLARAAMGYVYGLETVYAGPIYESMQVRDGKAHLRFLHTGGGLTVSGGGDGSLHNFAVAGADREFVWANARVEKDTVVVWSEKVGQPVAVRYAFWGNPEGCNLYNREGLPASPFRTDDWELPPVKGK